MVAGAVVVLPGDAVGVPVPGEVEEEAAPDQVARHPTRAAEVVAVAAVLSIHSTTELREGGKDSQEVL